MANFYGLDYDHTHCGPRTIRQTQLQAEISIKTEDDLWLFPLVIGKAV
jgi:hypothetical protein